MSENTTNKKPTISWNDRWLSPSDFKFFVKYKTSSDADRNMKLDGVDFQQEILDYIHRTNVNIFDFNNINFENVDEKTLKWIKTFNMRNTMLKKFMQSAKLKAKSGISGVVLRVLKDRIYPEVVAIETIPKWDNGIVIEVWFTQQYSVFFQSENLTVSNRLYLNKQGKYALETHWVPTGDEKLFDASKKAVNSDVAKKTYRNTFVYEDIDYCPLIFDLNNEDEYPDAYYATSAITAEAFFYSQVKKEWEWTKTQMLYNKVYGPTKEASEVQKEIEEGDIRVQETIDQQNLGDNSQSLTFLTAGSLTPDIAMASSKHFKTLRQELTLSVIPSDGGNNKHTTEILGANIHPLNYLWAKQNFTNLFLSEFYHKLLDITITYKKNNYKDITLEDFIEARVSLSRPTEILLNLNADSSEKNDETQKTIIDKQGEDNNA